jgi:hypothetical protein
MCPAQPSPLLSVCPSLSSLLTASSVLCWGWPSPRLLCSPLWLMRRDGRLPRSGRAGASSQHRSAPTEAWGLYGGGGARRGEHYTHGGDLRARKTRSRCTGYLGRAEQGRAEEAARACVVGRGSVTRPAAVRQPRPGISPSHSVVRPVHAVWCVRGAVWFAVVRSGSGDGDGRRGRCLSPRGMRVGVVWPRSRHASPISISSRSCESEAVLRRRDGRGRRAEGAVGVAAASSSSRSRACTRREGGVYTEYFKTRGARGEWQVPAMVWADRRLQERGALGRRWVVLGGRIALPFGPAAFPRYRCRAK